MSYVEVFTDGSAFGNARRNKHARAGVGVWFADDYPLNVSEDLLERFRGPCTNQRAELAACIRAIEQWQVLRQESRADYGLMIRTDSMYAINIATKWARNWQKRGWRKANGQPVENQDLVQRLWTLKQESDRIEFKHVAGHAGIYGNEMADRLAKAGAGHEEDVFEEGTLILRVENAPEEEDENAELFLESQGNREEDTHENHVFWF